MEWNLRWILWQAGIGDEYFNSIILGETEEQLFTKYGNTPAVESALGACFQAAANSFAATITGTDDGASNDHIDPSEDTVLGTL